MSLFVKSPDTDQIYVFSTLTAAIREHLTQININLAETHTEEENHHSIPETLTFLTLGGSGRKLQGLTHWVEDTVSMTLWFTRALNKTFKFTLMLF